MDRVSVSPWFIHSHTDATFERRQSNSTFICGHPRNWEFSTDHNRSLCTNLHIIYERHRRTATVDLFRWSSTSSSLWSQISVSIRCSLKKVTTKRIVKILALLYYSICASSPSLACLNSMWNASSCVIRMTSCKTLSARPRKINAVRESMEMTQFPRFVFTFPADILRHHHHFSLGVLLTNVETQIWLMVNLKEFCQSN